MPLSSILPPKSRRSEYQHSQRNQPNSVKLSNLFSKMVNSTLAKDNSKYATFMTRLATLANFFEKFRHAHQVLIVKSDETKPARLLMTLLAAGKIKFKDGIADVNAQKAFGYLKKLIQAEDDPTRLMSVGGSSYSISLSQHKSTEHNFDSEFIEREQAFAEVRSALEINPDADNMQVNIVGRIIAPVFLELNLTNISTGAHPNLPNVTIHDDTITVNSHSTSFSLDEPVLLDMRGQLIEYYADSATVPSTASSLSNHASPAQFSSPPFQPVAAVAPSFHQTPAPAAFYPRASDAQAEIAGAAKPRATGIPPEQDSSSTGGSTNTSSDEEEVEARTGGARTRVLPGPAAKPRATGIPPEQDSSSTGGSTNTSSDEEEVEARTGGARTRVLPGPAAKPRATGIPSDQDSLSTVRSDMVTETRPDMTQRLGFSSSVFNIRGELYNAIISYKSLRNGDDVPPGNYGWLIDNATEIKEEQKNSLIKIFEEYIKAFNKDLIDAIKNIKVKETFDSKIQICISELGVAISVIKLLDALFKEKEQRPSPYLETLKKLEELEKKCSSGSILPSYKGNNNTSSSEVLYDVWHPLSKILYSAIDKLDRAHIPLGTISTLRRVTRFEHYAFEHHET